MPLRNSQKDYGSVARFAHWATALFVALALPLVELR
jgi:cytochrome b561